MKHKITYDRGNDLLDDRFNSEIRIDGEWVLEVFEKDGSYFVRIAGTNNTTFDIPYSDFIGVVKFAREAVELPEQETT
jgi:hypothetical protein